LCFSVKYYFQRYYALASLIPFFIICILKPLWLVYKPMQAVHAPKNRQKRHAAAPLANFEFFDPNLNILYAKLNANLVV